MKTSSFKFFLATVFLLLFAVLLALPAPPGQALTGQEVWQQTYARFSGTAGETLAIGDVVAIGKFGATAGLIYKAEADNAELIPAVGVIGKGGSAGSAVEIIPMGILAGQTGASPGVRIFLDTNAGGTTVTEPDEAAQSLGIVLPSQTSLYSATSDVYFYFVAPAQASPGLGF